MDKVELRKKRAFFRESAIRFTPTVVIFDKRNYWQTGELNY